tara:strand:- start:6714 stop:6887 length:174 start_codon:yes stop_codon:yes gene_type:complete
MIEPKITMMSYRDGKVLGRVVVNGHEIAVQPFQVASDASASEKENALLKQAIKEQRR